MSAANVVVIGLWALVAVGVVERLSRRGAATFDEHLEPSDRRSVGMVAFVLAGPALVLASQLAAIGVAHATGVAIGRFETWIYWSSVEPALERATDPLARVAVAATGPLVLLGAAGSLLAWTRWAPGRAAVNLLRLETARVLMIVALAIDPMASLLARRGDLWMLREALDTLRPHAGGATLLGYGVVAAWLLFRWRRAHRLRALGTPLHDAARRARARLARDPGDHDALVALGAAELATGDPRAVRTLEDALASSGDDPRLELLLGRAHLEQGRAREAAEHLRQAGQLLEQRDDRPDLLLEVTLALGAARIALGDAEGALLTAEAACDAAPRDPRTLLMHADALVLGGRIEDARDRLERALADAEGALRREIRRRLAALERS